MRLVGGVVGAVIGAYFGNPYAGYAIGSMIGGALEGPQKFRSEGPRLTDLKVTNSSYSIGKPKIWGTYRLSGNLIMSTELKETKKEDVVESKGGGTEQTNVSYTYRVTCAYGLSEGVTSGCRRIWYEGKLVYDYGQNNAGFIGGIAGSIKFYKGTDTQMPDGSMEMELGVGEVSGYRTTCYIVFTDLDLTEFNNRIPQFTFELVRTQSDIDTAAMDIFDCTDNPGTGSTYIVYNDVNRFVYLNSSLDGSGGSLSLFKVDAVSNIVMEKNITGFLNGSYNNQIRSKQITVLDTGSLMIGNISIPGKGSAYKIYDQDTLRELITIDYTTFPDAENWPGYGGESFRAPPCLQKMGDYVFSMGLNAPGGKYQVLCFNKFGAPLNYDFPSYNYATYGTVDKHGLEYGNVLVAEEETGSLYFPITYTNFGGVTGTRAIIISKYEYSTKILTDNYKVILTGNGDYLVNDMYVDKVSRSIFFLYTKLSGTNTGNYILKYNIDTNTVISNIYLTDGGTPIGNLGNSPSLHFDPNNRKFFFKFGATGVGKIFYYRLDNGEIDSLDYSPNTIWGTNDITAEGACYIPQIGCEVYYSGLNKKILKNFGRRLYQGTYPLDQVVLEIIKDSGLKYEYIDVTELASEIVYGFVIANPSSIRPCLEMLAIAYNFNVVESDFKLKFRKNGTPSIRTIDISELSAINYTPDVKFTEDLTTERKQELELPRMINVSYADIDRDYQTSSQEAKLENVYTNEIQNIELPMVFNATQATQIANRILREQWIQRDTYTFQTNMDYFDIEPCDTVTIKKINDEGKLVTFEMKIVKKEKGGGIIKWTAVAEDSTVYDQLQAVGESGSDITQTIPVVSTSKLFFLDIPMMNNTDNDAGFYVATSRQNKNLNWKGSTVYVSNAKDGGYIDQATFFNEVVNGVCTTKLDNFNPIPSQEDSWNIFDNLSSVTVKIYNGTLSSISDDQLDQGINLCRIGTEMLQFKNATLQSGTTDIYVLTGFNRARLGTESFISTHGIGDVFILLKQSSDTILRIMKDSSSLNNELFYKNVTFKDTLPATYPIGFTNKGVALKPYSVNSIASLRATNGDINISWRKRVRGIALMQDYKDAIDLDGDYYEVEIYSEVAYTTVKRVYSVVGSQAVVYSTSEQIADFGSNQTTVYIKVFKTNKIVGRGYEKKATV